LEKFSYLKSQNAAYIDEMWQQFKNDPNRVQDSWRGFFEGLELGEKLGPEHTVALDLENEINLSGESSVAELISAYRSYGNLIANINPLESPDESNPLIDLANFGLSENDLDRSFFASRLIGLEKATLREIISLLRKTYCSSIGVEFMHIQDRTSREWLLSIMEANQNHETLSHEDKKYILRRLTEAETWETFLNTRFVGKKRFSLEGGESTIPLLDRLIEVAGKHRVNEIIVGMAHRGRLNVLTNVFGKKAEHIFTEFDEEYLANDHPDSVGIGDVKYHMGYSSDIVTRNNHKLHLSLAHNPSHLEFINPVVAGITRAKQRFNHDSEREHYIPIMIHGDASFAGQGIIYETLNLSQVTGYRVGGTVHVVINNQIGFTTDPTAGRSTPYSTDVAKMLDVPIFHVNGDDPEAVYRVATLAMEYRQTFKRDVVIDLICFRKYGHNEGDEPSFTQPLMYRKIKVHPGVRTLYANRLIAKGVIDETAAQEALDTNIALLESARKHTQSEKPAPFISSYANKWSGFISPREADLYKNFDTTVQKEQLLELSQKLTSFPDSFNLHPKLQRIFEARHQSITSGIGIDWATAETLAYSSLLVEGHTIRLTGQDVERGTFSHRHAVLRDYQTGERYTPFKHLEKDQGDFVIRNSILSEAAVLGFEYGWSLADPNALVIWEAQFGDFANGAQVIIDQFISSSEIKWRRACGLVLYLPHGFEGQGPEHSSARLERFLQLCGDNNLSVCNLTTPAQIFHAVRRQLKRNFRKPLVIMTPKSLLRHKDAVSSITDFTDGKFSSVLDDPRFESNPSLKSKVTRLILCSGKIYYELATEALAQNCENIAAVRIEELYPWPETQLAGIVNSYSNAKDIVWVQEEPRNQGAWTYVLNQWAGGYNEFHLAVGGRLIRYIGRKIAAAPASGSFKAHERIQRDIVKVAINK